MNPERAKSKKAGASQKLFDDALRHHRAGQLAEAERLYRQILAAEPAHADALHALGVAAHQTGRYETAVELITRAISVRDDVPSPHNDLGNALRRLGRIDEALAHYTRALRLDPGYAEAHNNLGIALKDQGKLDLAIDSFKRAAALKQDYAEAHYNLGNAFQDQGQPEEALECYRCALALKPDYAKAEMNLGNALRSLGNLNDALACYRRATSINPDYAEAHVNEALTLLLAGDFVKGWREYEWRWHLDYMKPPNLKAPLWDDGDLAGKTILLHCEQGFGDSIQFIRYAALVKERGAQVLLSCPPVLTRLLKGVAAIDRVFSEGADLPPYDYHAPLLSLPMLFGTKLDSIPSSVPYLAAPPEDAAHWAQRLLPYTRFKVGLVWAGNPRPDQPNAHAVDKRRSMKLAQFAPLADLDVQFISLQKGAPAAEAQTPPPGLPLADLADELNDFADTAALIANLDLVVGVDTSVIHLAGAMGKPVWLLSRYDGCWRWLSGREDSPWYPTLRLFRQPKAGDWESVIENLRVALDQHIKAKGGTHGNRH